MAIRIPHPREHLVFIPVGRQTARCFRRQFDPALRGADAPKRLRLRDVLHRKRQLRVVAADDEEPLAVGRQEHVVRAVLAAAGKLAEFLDLVEGVVVVGVGHAIEAAAGSAVADDVERVEGPEQSLGAGERHGNLFDKRRLRAVERGGCDPYEPLVALVAGDEPALGIGGEADPRAEILLWHDEEPLHLEAGRDGERLDRRLRRLFCVIAGDRRRHRLGRLFPDFWVSGAGGRRCRECQKHCQPAYAAEIRNRGHGGIVSEEDWPAGGRGRDDWKDSRNNSLAAIYAQAKGRAVRGFSHSPDKSD